MGNRNRRTATAEQADEGNGYVRAAIAEAYGAEDAETVTIQYGGSMNAKNDEELVAKVNVDGGLIGGASLEFLEGKELPGIAALNDK